MTGSMPPSGSGSKLPDSWSTPGMKWSTSGAFATGLWQPLSQASLLAFSALGLGDPVGTLGALDNTTTSMAKALEAAASALGVLNVGASLPLSSLHGASGTALHNLAASLGPVLVNTCLPAMEDTLKPLVESLSISLPDIADRLFPPDSLLALVLRVENQEPDMEQALTDLCKRDFTCRRVFYGERWLRLEKAFSNRCKDEEKPPAEVWDLLSRSALLMAIGDIPGDLPISQIYPHLRREVRKTIERDLLEGETLEEHEYRQVRLEPLPEETDESLSLIESPWSGIETWEDFLRAAQSLRAECQEACLARIEGTTDEELARKHGVAPSTVRGWRRDGLILLRTLTDS